MQFARGCAPFLAIPFLLAWVTLIMGIALDLVPILIIATLFFLVTCGMLVFFRDPEIPVGEGIVSPANGKVFAIEPTEDGRTAIRIFMNVNNIHVNRCPMDGTVVKVDHRLGGHIPAFNKDAETNERVVTDLNTAIGPVRIVQIAGSVARRIVPYISDGQQLSKGDRIGIIRLGSRVDLHLPSDRVEVTTKIGDTVHPNQTLARIIDPLDANASDINSSGTNTPDTNVLNTDPSNTAPSVSHPDGNQTESGVPADSGQKDIEGMEDTSA